MACRNCVDTCNCAIVSTDATITVTGSGTALDPYDVSLAVPLSITYTVPEVLAVQTGSIRFYFNGTATITNVTASVGVAPTGASIIVDVNKGGTTIFTTQANRPTITAGSNVDLTSTPDVTAVASGEYLTVDIDQVGSSVSGANLVVTVEYLR